MVYNYKYSQILGCHNNLNIMIFYGGTYEEDKEHRNRTILDGNMMNTYFIILEVNYSSIDSDDSSCHGYHIIKFSLYPYTLQQNLSIGGQVISSDEILC